MYAIALQDAGLGGGAGMIGEAFTSVGKIVKSASDTTALLKTDKERKRQFQIQLEAAKYFHVPGGTSDALAKALAMAATSPEEQLRSGSLPEAIQKGLPAWAWALIGVGGVAVLGGAAWMVSR